MTFSGERVLKDGANELVMRFQSPDLGGVRLVETYTLARGSYAIRVKHEVVNTGTVPVSPQLYLQLVRDGNKPPGESSFYSTFTGPAVYTDAKKYQKVEFSDIEKGKADIEKTSPNGYVAMVQHYFAVRLVAGRWRGPRIFRPQGRQQPLCRGHDHSAEGHRAGRHPSPWNRGFSWVRRKKKCSSRWRRAWNWSRTMAG